MANLLINKFLLHLKTFQIFLLIFCSILSLSESRQQLKLVENGYNGLVIGISEHVPQEHCNKVIHGIRVSAQTINKS